MFKFLATLVAAFSITACGGGGSIETPEYILCHPDAEDCTQYFQKASNVYQIKPIDEYVITDLGYAAITAELNADRILRSGYVVITVK